MNRDPDSGGEIGAAPQFDVPATDAQELIQIVNQIMPFGRFQGRRLIELPEPYLVWFHNRGFPEGALGRRMAAMYEIKVNGLEKLLQPLIGR